MLKLDNKVFSLIELLAAMVILIILFSSIMVSTGVIIRNSNKNAFIINAKAYASSLRENSYQDNLSIDEEDEVIECAKLIKYTILDYKLKSKKSINIVSSTRYEREMSKYLVKSLERMNKNNENSKLKYIFYEIYNEKCDDIEKVYSKLINITKNNDNKFIKLKNLIGLIENKKIMSNNS